MEKFDIKKDRRDLYGPSAKEFEIVEVPDMAFLMIDGQGDPNTSEFYAEAVESLFAASYGLKFASKKELGEGLTPSGPWKGFGGRMTSPYSPPANGTSGIGRCWWSNQTGSPPRRLKKASALAAQ